MLVEGVLEPGREVDLGRLHVPEPVEHLVGQGGCSVLDRPGDPVFLAADTPFLGSRLAGQTKWLTFFSTEAGIPEPADWFVTLGDCDLELAWAGS